MNEVIIWAQFAGAWLLEQITSFRNKATGWYTVALGGFLLAAGESWEVTEHYDWPVWVFWVLLVVMLVACLLNTAVRMIRDHHARQTGTAEPAAG
jgi:hypothetical protein